MLFGFAWREVLAIPAHALLGALTLIGHVSSGGTMPDPINASDEQSEIAYLRDINARLTGHLTTAIEALRLIAAVSDEAGIVRDAIDALLGSPHGVEHMRTMGLK